jgi:hypothetical protein
MINERKNLTIKKFGFYGIFGVTNKIMFLLFSAILDVVRQTEHKL